MNEFNVVGIGIGPANLSLAALLSKVTEIKARFFDEMQEFEWHPGLLFSDTNIQVSFLEDLVTFVDPTNPFSFISYLSKHKRLYRFVNARFKHALRLEFSHYFAWVSQSLTNLSFANKIEKVEFKQNKFFVYSTNETVTSQHLVLGSGLKPFVPLCARPLLSKTLFHGHYFRQQNIDFTNKNVMIIGGGQSGAEIVRQLLGNKLSLPKRLIWSTRRYQFLPLDYSTFVTELFFPNYVQHFYQQKPEHRAALLEEQKLSSDGISEAVLQEIYRQLYTLEYLEGKGKFATLHTGCHLFQVTKNAENYTVCLQDRLTKEIYEETADIVILTTGYHWEMPPYLEELRNHIPLINSNLIVNEDYAVQWDGPSKNKIYIQNGARHSHGISDRNLTLMAWRSATIINSMLGRDFYDIDNEESTMNWSRVRTKQSYEEEVACNA